MTKFGPRNKPLNTRKELFAAIRAAKTVLVLPRFGSSEYWIRVTKADAIRYVTSIVNEDDTPQDCEMYGASFGTLDDTTVFLG